MTLVPFTVNCGRSRLELNIVLYLLSGLMISRCAADHGPAAIAALLGPEPYPIQVSQSPRSSELVSNINSVEYRRESSSPMWNTVRLAKLSTVSQ